MGEREQVAAALVRVELELRAAQARDDGVAAARWKTAARALERRARRLLRLRVGLNRKQSEPAGVREQTGNRPPVASFRRAKASRRQGPKAGRNVDALASTCSVRRMARVIALAGQKGGSGKSTLAINLAVEALARGLRVLLVDADSQGTARTWGAVALEAGHPAPTIVSMGADLHKPGQLPALASGFDLVLVDCPPRHAEVQRAALMVADLALLPSGPSAHDVWALAESVELVKAAQRVRPELQAVALVTRKVPGTVIGEQAREALAGVGLPLLRASLGFRVAFQEAPAAGLGVTAYAPTSEAADEVRAMADEVLGMVTKTKSKRRLRVA